MIGSVGSFLKKTGQKVASKAGNLTKDAASKIKNKIAGQDKDKLTKAAEKNYQDSAESDSEAVDSQEESKEQQETKNIQNSKPNKIAKDSQEETWEEESWEEESWEGESWEEETSEEEEETKQKHIIKRGVGKKCSDLDTMKFNYQQSEKKATTILSPHLEAITYGSMIIVLENSQTSLPYDKPIAGKIKVNLKTAFEARAVTLSIRGYQRSHFLKIKPGNQQNSKKSSREKTIIYETFVVHEFPPNVNPLGQSEYAFYLHLPDLVTESVMCQLKDNSLSSTFYLVAQLEPRNPKDFANLEDKTSKLRTDYPLYLYKPIDRVNEQELVNPADSRINPNLSKKSTMQVGGLKGVGLGTTECKAVISLEKERYAPGEKIKVHFDVDNSKCRKAVKSFKIKLKRTIHIFNGLKSHDKPLLTDEEEIYTQKYDGCPKKSNETRTIEFEVPLYDEKIGFVEKYHPDQRHMVKMFCDSADNTLFKIEYVLDIFVKHKAPLERGQGAKTSFKITVKSGEQNLPGVATKEQSWMTSQDISNWKPQPPLLQAEEKSSPGWALSVKREKKQENVQPVFRIMHLFFTKSSDNTFIPVSSLQSRKEIEDKPEETKKMEEQRKQREEAERLRIEDLVKNDGSVGFFKAQRHPKFADMY